MHPLKFLLLFLAGTCLPGNTMAQPTDYIEAIAKWRSQRLEELRAPLGWLSLTGLYWLKEGDNTFGSTRGNDLLFPVPALPRMGTFRLEGERVLLTMSEGVQVKCNGKLVLKEDITPRAAEAPLCEWESLSWVVISRAGRFGVRLWDRDHLSRVAFDTVPYFAVDTSWKIPARFIPYDPPRTLQIDNVVGMKIDQEVPGRLVFNLRGEPFSLEVFDGGPSDFFVIFADETTGAETYGGGRYLYVPRPDATGRTSIDFNRAYNPPCAFTAYATCLLPPQQNRLPAAVRAGELDYGDH